MKSKKFSYYRSVFLNILMFYRPVHMKYTGYFLICSLNIRSARSIVSAG